MEMPWVYFYISVGDVIGSLVGIADGDDLGALV